MKKSELPSRILNKEEGAPRKRVWDKKPNEDLNFLSKPTDSKQLAEPFYQESLTDKTRGVTGQLMSKNLTEDIQIEEEAQKQVVDEINQSTGMKYGDPFVNNLFSKDKLTQQEEKGAAGANLIKYKTKDTERDTFIDLDDIKGQISQVNKNIGEIEKRNAEQPQKSTVVVGDSNQAGLPRNIQITNPFMSPEKSSIAGDQKQDSPSLLSHKVSSNIIMTPGQASVVSIDRKQLVPTTLEEIYKKKIETTNVSLNTSTLSPDRVYNIPDQKISGVSHHLREKFGTHNAWEEKLADRTATEGLDVSRAEPFLVDEIQASFNQISKALQNISHLLEGAPKDQLEKERTRLIQAVDAGLNDTRTNLNILSYKGSNLLNSKFENPSEGNMRNVVATASRDIAEIYSELLLRKIEDKLAMSFVVPRDP